MYQRILVRILLIGFTTTLESSQSRPSCSNRNTDYTKCACESKENLSISCTNNQTILILNATYGRLENETCNDRTAHNYQNWSISCRSHNSKDVLSKNCNNQPTCSIEKDKYNGYFDEDPCPGTGKYLLVNYTCLSAHLPSAYSTAQTTTKSTEGSCQCQEEVRRSVSWPTTDCGRSQKLNCPNNRKRKMAERSCSEDGSWELPNLVRCKTEEIERMGKELDILKANFSVSVANEMMRGVKNTSLNKDLYGGDLYELTKVMVALSELRQHNSKSCTASNADDFSELVLNSTSNLLSNANNETWLELPPDYQSKAATRLLVAMEGSHEVLAKATKNPDSIGRTAPGIEELKVDVSNVSVTELQTSTVVLNTSDVLMEISGEDVAIQAQGDLCTDGLGRAVFILYNDIAKWLTTTPKNDDQTKNIAADDDSHLEPKIITKVVSASIISDKEHSVKLTNPIRFTLRHTSHPRYSSSMSCVFWNFSKVDFVGQWSDGGCKVVSSNKYSTTCECDHLTNFAVLMSAVDTKLIHIQPHQFHTLSVLSTIGCSISVCALVLTIFIYAVTWNDVKSHQAAVLLNLCVSLIAADTIFLAGIDKVDHRIGCAAVAVLLHYFFLAALFIMLVEGIQLLIYVVFVFRTRRKLQTVLLLVAAWVLPLIILTISLGITKAHGYGTNTACWLSIANNLIWAFLGPVLVIMIVNAIIIVIVLVKIYTRRLSSNKNDNKAKIRGMIWNIAVITPLLGITWLLGFFIGYSLIIEYIFTIVNSLQGLFIFIFHVLFQNKKFNTRLSSLAARYMCSNCNRKQQTGSKDDTMKATTDQTFINLPSCSKESQINSFSDAVEKQTTSIDKSSAFTIISSDKSSSETEISSHNVTAETYSLSINPKNNTG